MLKPVVAVIERDPDVLLLVQEFLAHEGFQPIVRAEASGAFELILREKPDLVILDVWLEHQYAGEMLLGLLHIDPATQNIPVLICTTDARFPDRHADFRGNLAYDTLIKPFALHTLRGKLEGLMSRKLPANAPEGSERSYGGEAADCR